MTLPVWRRLWQWIWNHEEITRLDALRLIVNTEEKNAARVDSSCRSRSTGSDAGKVVPLAWAGARRRQG
jgi:hypothetical protein